MAKKHYAFRLPSPLMKKFQALCVKQEITFTEKMTQLVDDYMNKEDKLDYMNKEDKLDYIIKLLEDVR